MSSDLAISIRDLGKAYNIYRNPQDRLKQMIWRRRQFYELYWAVHDISLDIGRGETVGIIGRNGSGKSTMLQIIAGTLTPSRGTVQVNGRVAALLELGAGFNPEFTGRENIYLAASVLGLTGRQIDERLESIVDFAAIGDFLEQPVKLYSSGMYARLAFAVAAHVDADVLIVDETLSVGDAAFTQKCMRFIRKFKENGTLLFVSHDTGAVINLCDRAVWLDRGMVRAVGPSKEVCQDYLIAIEQERDDSSSFRIGGRQRPVEAPPARVVQDPRHELIDNSVHRNEIELFDFDPEARWFGQRGAEIRNVTLQDANGHPLAGVTGGEEVILCVDCLSETDVNRPIVGFQVKDRLGQFLFGDNTYLTYRYAPVPVPAGHSFQTRFRFQMPYLPTGDYSVVVALSDGTQDDHVHHHWIEDALIFKVHSSHITRGLVGIPMLGIRMDVHQSETSVG
ncbi:ABC transporter ATP-binding protein (plasmid) [Azospirillum sp. TSH58]|uniref:ABC transporter ATP-binding protein n=1 Tax=Azospirillum sp. TSH58 TaxID=664962 RepID=UPI000D5FF156|nr:ABC transporter ATP-binding protein [Azospirillum sp. TSH58]AWJ85517.1 ABC transporter ATP-binding protein [Azospirillum sp. TSH58]PWC81030.1 ABC transporter ATP-binding protein [Azospirillum sp. TSH58]